MSVSQEAGTSDTARAQVELINDWLPVSSNPLSNVTLGLGLTAGGLRGKRILDVASGLSDFVCQTNEQGGNAVGVDLRYGNLGELRAKGEEYTGEQLRRTTLSTMTRRPEETDPETLALYEDIYGGGAMARCVADMAKSPGRYVAGSVLDLPFANGAFQVVITHSFLTSLGGDYSQFVQEALLEMLRVTERGGSVRLGPTETSIAGGSVGRKTEQDLRAAFEKAKALKLADKISKYSIGDGMYWYNISRSRKR